MDTNAMGDIRAVIRTLMRTPGTTAVIVFTLALGIGANASIFSLLNAVVLRPLPIPQPEELVSLQTSIEDNVDGAEPFSFPAFQELARDQKVFANFFACDEGGLNNLEAEGNHYTAGIANVSGDYYAAMRIAPVLGRFINRSDVAMESGTSNAVAVIKYRVWRSWFQGGPNVIGKTIRLGVHPFTVIGVEPEGFNGLAVEGYSEVTVPIFAPNSGGKRDAKLLWLDAWGRLRPGITLEQARASLQTIWPEILKETVPPDYSGAKSTRYFARRLKIEAGSHGVSSSLRRTFSHPLGILLALVGSLLLIACLNLANLSIAKMAAQRHDWSIKLALGAGPWQLVRPILIESFLLAAAGAALGLAIAYWTGPLLLHMAWTGFVPIALNASPDPRVLAFTAGVTVLTAFLFTIVPAFYALRAGAADGMRQNSRSVHQGSSQLGRLLLVSQVALSLVMVAGALLFAKTLSNLHNVNAGYKRDHLLTAQLFPQAGQEKLPNRDAYFHALGDKVKGIPGVAAVAYSNGAPGFPSEYRRPMRLAPESKEVQAIDEVIGPEFFATMDIPVLAGREFAWSDDENNLPVAIVSKKFAEQLYGSANAVGRDFYWGVVSIQKKLRIVGIVNNASLWKVESVEPMAVYRPMLQNPTYNEPLLDVRTMVDPASLKSTVDRTIRGMGSQYSLRTATLDERLDGFATAQRLTALLAGFFGVVAVLIAAIGLYGLMSFHVTQRTTEMGVRLALGAQSWQVFAMVLREVMLIAALGCGLGLLASVSLRSYVASLLFGISATDPLLLAMAVLVLAVVGIIAGFLPARRAASVDPAVALRKE